MPLSRKLAFAFAVVIGLLLPMTASAQSITIATVGVTRTVFLHNDLTTRFWISRPDCLADDTLDFPVTITGGGGDSIEVWASEGADCSVLETRSSTSDVSCWQVFVQTAINNTLQTVSINVQDIAAGATQSIKHAEGQGSSASCTPPANSATGAQPITLFFLLVSGQTTPAQTTWQQTKLDLVGPQAVTQNALGIGDTELLPSWSSASDPDTTGFQFFCDPIPSQTGSQSQALEVDEGGTTGTGTTDGASTGADAGAADASTTDGGDAAAGGGVIGVAGSSGTDGGDDGSDTGTVSSNCPSVVLQQGVDPNTLSKFSCGSATGISATSGAITGLTNGALYTVGIAPTDAVGNFGNLSNVQCETPQVVIGFPERLQADGGPVSTSFCSVGLSRKDAQSSAWPFVLLGMFGLATGIRRSSRRRMSN